MAEDWSGFEEVGAEADEWAGFEEVEPKRSRRKKPRNPPPPLDSSASITRPIDGDTLRLSNDSNLRLWGVDAPELNQPGWTQSGQQVPAGQNSLEALAGHLRSGAAVAGPAVSHSYGRPVAPVTVDDARVP